MSTESVSLARVEQVARYQVQASEAEAYPLDWAEVFGRPGPLGVEVGFGNGEALGWWATQEPSWNLVGIERPPECLLRAAPRIAAAGAEHVRLLAGDARVLLHELFAPGTVQKVLMQFPMPWPRKRHAKHRVANSGFAEVLADVLAPGGHFELVTDQGWYAEEARKAFAACGWFEVGPVEEDPDRPFRTRYETKWLEDGRSIHRLVATLPATRPRPRFFLSGPMLHLFLDEMPTDAQLAARVGRRFDASDRRGRKLVGEVKEALRSLDPRGGHLVRVVAADGGFSQMFALRFEPRSDGRCLLKIESQPRPYHTEAVGFLVHALAEDLRTG